MCPLVGGLQRGHLAPGHPHHGRDGTNLAGPPHRGRGAEFVDYLDAVSYGQGRVSLPERLETSLIQMDLDIETP
jgi:hypothetical protein